MEAYHTWAVVSVVLNSIVIPAIAGVLAFIHKTGERIAAIEEKIDSHVRWEEQMKYDSEASYSGPDRRRKHHV